MVKTKSAVFILPMIMGVPIKYFSGFTNVFIGNSFSYGSKEGSERIFLVFRNDIIREQYYTRKEITIENEARIASLTNSPQYIDKQKIGSYTVFSYKPSDKFTEDYSKFKEGKYSEFSNKYKQIIKRHYPSSGRVDSILNPTNEDRAKLAKELNVELNGKCEIFSSPNNIEEEFSRAKFLEINI